MLDQKVKAVADLRQQLARVEAVQDTVQAMLADTPEYITLQAIAFQRSGIKERLEEVEDELRATAVENYDGESVPHEAIYRVGVYKTLDYSQAEALGHCREHLPQVVKLDKRAFEKLMRAGLELAFVIVGQEYRASLKSDLSPWESAVPSGAEK